MFNNPSFFYYFTTVEHCLKSLQISERTFKEDGTDEITLRTHHDSLQIGEADYGEFTKGFEIWHLYPVRINIDRKRIEKRLEVKKINDNRYLAVIPANFKTEQFFTSVSFITPFLSKDIEKMAQCMKMTIGFACDGIQCGWCRHFYPGDYNVNCIQ